MSFKNVKITSRTFTFGLQHHEVENGHRQIVKHTVGL